MKVAVVCSNGIGDALMMMIASYRLQQEGYEVTTFQETIGQLNQWFPNQHFARRSTITTKSLDSFDFILLQNDNTPFSFNLIDRYRAKIHVFYSSYEQKKHHPLTAKDYLFANSKTMVTNIAEGVATLLGQVIPIEENGITIPQGLSHRKYKNRIIIHPMSTDPKRRWKAKKFVQVAKKLKKEGFEPVFALSYPERKEWLPLIENDFPVPQFPTISDLAAYLYESNILIGNESGTGHLASNLGIPTLIIARCKKQIGLWRPGFLTGEVITPSSYIPNVKCMRIREKKWKTLISSQSVLKTFHKMVTIN